MTARNNGSAGPPTVDLEDQIVLRVPEHIAIELRKLIQAAKDKNAKNFDTHLAFALEGTSKSMAE